MIDYSTLMAEATVDAIFDGRKFCLCRRNLQKRFAAALTARGEHQVKRTSKYIVFSRKEGGCYYLGRVGALRIGKTTRGSVPCSESFRKELLGHD